LCVQQYCRRWQWVIIINSISFWVNAQFDCNFSCWRCVAFFGERISRMTYILHIYLSLLEFLSLVTCYRLEYFFSLSSSFPELSRNRIHVCVCVPTACLHRVCVCVTCFPRQLHGRRRLEGNKNRLKERILM